MDWELDHDELDTLTELIERIKDPNVPTIYNPDTLNVEHIVSPAVLSAHPPDSFVQASSSSTTTQGQANSSIQRGQKRGFLKDHEAFPALVSPQRVSTPRRTKVPRVAYASWISPGLTSRSGIEWEEEMGGTSMLGKAGVDYRIWDYSPRRPLPTSSNSSQSNSSNETTSSFPSPPSAGAIHQLRTPNAKGKQRAIFPDPAATLPTPAPTPSISRRSKRTDLSPSATPNRRIRFSAAFNRVRPSKAMNNVEPLCFPSSPSSSHSAVLALKKRRSRPVYNDAELGAILQDSLVASAETEFVTNEDGEECFMLEDADGSASAARSDSEDEEVGIIVEGYLPVTSPTRKPKPKSPPAVNFAALAPTPFPRSVNRVYMLPWCSLVFLAIQAGNTSIPSITEWIQTHHHQVAAQTDLPSSEVWSCLRCLRAAKLVAVQMGSDGRTSEYAIAPDSARILSQSQHEDIRQKAMEVERRKDTTVPTLPCRIGNAYLPPRSNLVLECIRELGLCPLSSVVHWLRKSYPSAVAKYGNLLETVRTCMKGLRMAGLARYVEGKGYELAPGAEGVLMSLEEVEHSRPHSETVAVTESHEAAQPVASSSKLSVYVAVPPAPYKTPGSISNYRGYPPSSLVTRNGIDSHMEQDHRLRPLQRQDYTRLTWKKKAQSFSIRRQRFAHSLNPRGPPKHVHFSPPPLHAAKAPLTIRLPPRPLSDSRLRLRTEIDYSPRNYFKKLWKRTDSLPIQSMKLMLKPPPTLKLLPAPPPHPLRVSTQNRWNSNAHSHRVPGIADITIVNNIDSEAIPPVPAGFGYREAGYEFPDTYEPPNRGFFMTCNCTGACSKCPCSVSADEAHITEPPYDKNVVNLENVIDESGLVRYIVVECNQYCQCATRLRPCFNRLAQQPRVIPIEIFKTKRRGWAARSTSLVMKGQIVGTYTGELIPRSEAEELEGTEGAYCYDLNFEDEKYQEKDQWSINAYRCGNWTRFINHSCESNLFRYLAEWDTVPQSHIYHIIFVARRDIQPGEELTIDYDPEGGGAAESKRKRRRVGKACDYGDRCHCGSKNCRGAFPTR